MMENATVSFAPANTTRRREGLDQMRPGEQGKIVGFVDDQAVVRRLRSMGVLPGCSITLLRSAPFRDPLQIAVGGFSLSIRRADAALVTVELD